jgi:hypothetical protein
MVAMAGFLAFSIADYLKMSSKLGNMTSKADGLTVLSGMIDLKMRIGNVY